MIDEKSARLLESHVHNLIDDEDAEELEELRDPIHKEFPSFARLIDIMDAQHMAKQLPFFLNRVEIGGYALTKPVKKTWKSNAKPYAEIILIQATRRMEKDGHRLQAYILRSNNKVSYDNMLRGHKGMPLIAWGDICNYGLIRQVDATVPVIRVRWAQWLFPYIVQTRKFRAQRFGPHVLFDLPTAADYKREMKLETDGDGDETVENPEREAESS